jgi:hypothetical protein
MRWIGLLLVLAPFAAWAQASMAQEFAAVLQDSGHRQDVLAAAQATPAWAQLGCAAGSYAPQPEVGVYVPVQFDGAGAPVAGEWREGILASGCGRKLMLNVLTKVTAPATLASGPLIPGGTIADPGLQNLAQGYVAQAAGGLPAGCTNAFIADTVFEGYDGKAAAGDSAPWRETWTIDLCGAVKAVALTFVPGPQGVAVDAKVK